MGRRNTLFSVFRDRNILVCQVQPAIGKPRPLRGKKKPFSRGSSHFLRERKPRTHTYTPAPMSRLSLTIHSVGTSHSRSLAEMKVEGEEGRGSVKVPFITATRALPPSASGCRARNRYDVRCCASLAVGMFAKRSWSWYGCPDIYQRQRFQEEGIVWQALPRAEPDEAVQTEVCQIEISRENSLVFTCTPFLCHSYIAFGYSRYASFDGLGVIKWWKWDILSW